MNKQTNHEENEGRKEIDEVEEVEEVEEVDNLEGKKIDDVDKLISKITDDIEQLKRKVSKLELIDPNMVIGIFIGLVTTNIGLLAIIATIFTAQSSRIDALYKVLYR